MTESSDLSYKFKESQLLQNPPARVTHLLQVQVSGGNEPREPTDGVLRTWLYGGKEQAFADYTLYLVINRQQLPETKWLVLLCRYSSFKPSSLHHVASQM